MYSSETMKFRCRKCGNLFGYGYSDKKIRHYETEKDWKAGYDGLNLVDEKIELFCSKKCLDSFMSEKLGVENNG